MAVKVGIVVPSYNQGIYLERTLQSIIANRKNIDIKIAVIDGGSTDNSVDIIKKYETQIDYWVSEKDNGQSDAINKGFRQLEDCGYYMWLNSDDVYDDDTAVSRIVGYAVKNNFEVVYAKSHYIDEYDNITGDYETMEFNRKLLSKRCFLSQPSVMFSRKAYNEVGELNVSLRMCMDYEYWMRLSRVYRFGYLKEYIGNTRIYSLTKTSTMRKRSLQEGICLIKHYYGTVPKDWTLPYLHEETPKKNIVYYIDVIMTRLPGKIKNITINRLIKQFGLDIKYMD